MSASKDHFSREEVDELAIGQLQGPESDSALMALNGFAELFGKAWVTDYFGGARAPGLVRAITSLWSDWTMMRSLPKSQDLIQRWKDGIWREGVEPEVRDVAALLREGGEVELFPGMGSRIPDCRVKAAG